MAHPTLRILFVSGYFPPRAPMGAVRTGKLAEHWRVLGHDVRTIAIDLPSSKGVEQSATHARVDYVPYKEPGRTITRLKSSIVQSTVGRLVFSGLPLVRRHGLQSQTSRAEAASSVRKLGLIDLYRQALAVPDRYKSWIKPAILLGLSWQDLWKPDLIYSSGPPHSGHVVAEKLSLRLEIPWIAELRDLWVGDPYFDRHKVVKPFHDRLAKTTLSHAAACVVVTDASAARLGSIIQKPILLSYNGYDPKDFEGLANVDPFDSERLTIIHAGTIYPGRRDPSPLFKAISALGEQGLKVRCLFFSDANGSVAALAKRYDVGHSVEIYDEVPRSQILRLERQVDILLECRWQDRAGDGVIPGKLFEYIGACRPILSIGSLTGEAAEIIRRNNLGLVSNDPDEIKAMLLECLEVKARLGRLPDRIDGAESGFRRETQFQKIDCLMNKVLVSAHSGPT